MPNNYNPYSFGYSGTGNNYASYRTNDPNNFGGSRFGDPYANNNFNQQFAQVNPFSQQSIPQPIAGLKGRMINREEEITAGEIPMDNTLSLFPLNDYSCIYAKQWQPNGTITTVKYVPEVVKPESQPQQTVDNEIIERLDTIESMLRQQRRSPKPTYRKNQNGINHHKKEVEDA